LKTPGAVPPAPSPLRRAVTKLRRLFRKSPEQQYVDNMLKKIARGAKHSTLGPQIRDEVYTRGKAERWAERLIEVGLKPQHLCVEYGCGSLWAAEPVLRYLQPGRYYGLDLTDQFYEFGRQRIGSLLAEKQARLAVISPESLRAVAALQPDFIFSRKVLAHVKVDALPRYLANIASLMSPQTIAMIDNHPLEGPDGTITGREYSIEDLRPHLPATLDVQQAPFAVIIRAKA
jgi:hypothetical protein